MKLLYILYIAALTASCSGQNRNADNATETNNTTRADSTIHPLLEIGSYYIYKIKPDTTAGLLLAGIRKEDDSVYYSFILSGGFFNTVPDEKEFQAMGLCGMKIPNSSSGNFEPSFSYFSISETRLNPLVEQFKKIGHIQYSIKNTNGSKAFINHISELSDEPARLKTKNEQMTNEMKGLNFPMPEFLVLSWDDLIIARHADEVAKPEIVWILSAKNAHPKAAALMKEEWWWDHGYDFAPFGNDDGSDAFYTFKDWRENNKTAKSIKAVDYLHQGWGMSFDHIHNDNETDLPKIEKTNQFYRSVDRGIIGLAFGQLILEGAVAGDLKALGLKAIKRTNTTFGMSGMSEENKTEYRKRLNEMERVLQSL